MWSYIAETMGNLLHQTAFLNLTWGNYVMIAVACVFLYLGDCQGIRTIAFSSDRIWYAFGKYLSGYHRKPGGDKQRCRWFTVLFLSAG